MKYLTEALLGVFCEKTVPKISQNSQENPSVRVSFLIKRVPFQGVKKWNIDLRQVKWRSFEGSKSFVALLLEMKT